MEDVCLTGLALLLSIRRQGRCCKCLRIKWQSFVFSLSYIKFTLTSLFAIAVKEDLGQDLH